MKLGSGKVSALIAALVLAVGCSKQTNYLHYVAERPAAVKYDTVHKVKEPQGESRGDILWVIDNSGSMGAWQQEVIRNTSAFMQGFVQKTTIDWKMGLISTDQSGDPYVGFPNSAKLDSHVANPVSVFQDAVTKLGTMGDATERTFTPVRKALTTYPQFIRNNAALILIVVTDAPEQSAEKAQDFINFLQQTKGDLRRVYSYGIFSPQDWGCEVTDSPWNYAGSPYEELMKATHGKTYKLCDRDFGKNLIDVGKDLGSRIAKPRLQLTSRPVLGTVRVYYHGKELPGGSPEDGGYWFYGFDENSIVFHNLDFAPADDEEVRVSYTVDDGRPLSEILK